jgi:hypothetical protein
VRPKSRMVLDRCILEGIEYGLSKAYKHTNSPSRANIITELERGIWNEIDAYFQFIEELEDPIYDPPVPEDLPEPIACRNCGCEDTWFDRTITVHPVTNVEGMYERCRQCGEIVD